MTTLRAVCPHCSDEVDLEPADITLHLPLPVRGAGLASGGRYAFRCPACTDLVVKPADPRTVELLVIGEVNIVSGRTAPWERLGAADGAAEGAHPEAPGDGPAFTPDDLLEFHELLERPDWFATIAGPDRLPR